MQAKVLIADDSASMRVILKEALLRNGCTVVGEAADGKEAVEMYDRLEPDILTLDISMPVMNGLEALKAIKAEHPDARIVMVSAMGQQELVIDAMKAGAADFFIKPILAERVMEAIEKALG